MASWAARSSAIARISRYEWCLCGRRPSSRGISGQKSLIAPECGSIPNGADVLGLSRWISVGAYARSRFCVLAPFHGLIAEGELGSGRPCHERCVDVMKTSAPIDEFGVARASARRSRSSANHLLGRSGRSSIWERLPPCCGHPEMSERGGYEICGECHWEDGDHDSDVRRGAQRV